MKMDTRTILYHLVDLCKQEHKIASDEVIDYYLSKNLLTITREKSVRMHHCLTPSNTN